MRANAGAEESQRQRKQHNSAPMMEDAMVTIVCRAGSLVRATAVPLGSSQGRLEYGMRKAVAGGLDLPANTVACMRSSQVLVV